MMSADYKPVEQKLPMGVEFKRKKADRLEFLPVTIDDEGRVTPVSYHGSAHIHAIGLADGLMRIPKGIHEIIKGAEVHVRPV